MRRHRVRERRRKDVFWYALGFVMVQIALAVGLEIGWTEVRDPDGESLERLVADRRAEAPTRPLFLAMGSSRTLMGLQAAKLNLETEDSPLVLNCSILGGGPMMQQVILRRLLAAGHRPARVFLEVIPVSLSARDGTPIEERQKFTHRFTAAEVAWLRKYYAEPYRLYYPWLFHRLIPCERDQAEFRDSLGLDKHPEQERGYRGRDAYGWSGCTRQFSSQEIEALTQEALVQFASALRQSAAAPGAVQAVRDLLQLCRDKAIAVEIIVPPEGSLFRNYSPAVAESQMQLVRDLAWEFGVTLTDARAWVADDGFWDGHHLMIKGADHYTERFKQEVLTPHLRKMEQ